MSAVSIAGLVFAAAAAGAAAFQVALALGAPWCAYAMGFNYTATIHMSTLVAAVVQALILGGLAGVVLARAGLMLATWAPTASWLIWVAVAFSAVSLLLNSITTSTGERLVWVPVAIVMLASSLAAALLG